MMVQGILLDVDGTLVLSNDAHALAWVEAFAEHGYTVEFDAVRALIGMGGDKLIPHLFPSLSKESGPGKTISEYRSRLFLDKYAQDLKPAPGSRELVERLLHDGLKLIVASSAKDSELEILLRAANVEGLLTEATTSSDTDGSKPEPDIVLVALDKIGMTGSEVVMLGDTPYDIEAAAAAGVAVIAVRCGGWNDADLRGAKAIYDDPADVLASYETSPIIAL